MQNRQKIILSSTSFLLPNNVAWNSLAEIYDLKFFDYGNWANSFIDVHSDEILCVILYLDDLISNENSTDELWQNKVSGILELIRKRCNHAIAPTVVCLSIGSIENVIRNAKISSAKNQAFNFLLNNLYGIASEFSTLYIANLEAEFAKIGIEKSLDSRNWYLYHCRNTADGLRQISRSIKTILQRHYYSSGKVLVLDCDQTLWGGVVGEDGLAGLILGQDGIGTAYLDFQREIKLLAGEGIILALASKNNEADIWHVFENHDSMIIKREDLLAWRINWKDKPVNLEELGAEIGVGLDSFIFWDDNPLERDLMRKILPVVNTIEVADSVFDWPLQLRNLNIVNKFHTTQEDIEKTKHYKERRRFISGLSAAQDKIDYLKSIKLQAHTVPIDDDNIIRAEQICAKTNQFNLRTVRHTQNDLLKMHSKNSQLCFLVELKDVYSNHGKVGFVRLEAINSKIIFIETFILSCRVLGRYLENWILSKIIDITMNQGMDYIIGEFILTEKNIMAKNFYQQNGFRKINQSELPHLFDEKSKYSRSKGDFYLLDLSSVPTVQYVDIYG